MPPTRLDNGAHRLGRNQALKDKSIILKNVNKLKESDVYINEDFSRETTEFKERAVGQGKAVASKG